MPTLRRVLYPFFLFLFASSLCWSSQAFPDLVKDYVELKLGDAVAISELKFEWAHLNLELPSGVAAPLFAGSNRVGVFLKGNGTVSYRSSDPFEHPLTLTNLKHATKIRPEKVQDGLVIRDTFTEAVLLGAGDVTLPNVSGAPSPAVQTDFDTHQAFFARDISTPFAHFQVMQKIDAPTRSLIRVQLRGGKEPMVYEYDDVFSRSEWLYSLTELSKHGIGRLSQYLFPAHLSEQPIKRDRREPIPPRIVLTDVNYVLIASEGQDATLSIVETLKPVVPQQIVRLDLYDIVHEDDEKPPRRYNVQKVLDENGRELAFHHHRDQLIIGLGSRAVPNRPFKLTFEIDGNFLIRPRNSSFWQLSLEPWFPQPEMSGLRFTVTSTIKVKPPFTAFAPGKTVRRATEAGYNIVENRLDVPVDGTVVHAGKYVVKEETRNGITVRVATYVMRNDRAVRELTDLTFAAIAFYEPFLGPFPFSEFNIIQVDSYGYGQAPPGTMFITHEAFTSVIDELSQIYSEGVNERFLHEIAHQYWGNVVSFPNFEEQWLSESFAEYCAALALRKGKGESTFKRMLNTWRTNGKQASPVAPIPLANWIHMPNAPAEQFTMRQWLLYQKGPYLLAVLHKELGDEIFLTFLKSYQKSFAWKYGSTKHVIGLLKVLTKKDYTPFFESYFWGTAMPEMPK